LKAAKIKEEFLPIDFTDSSTFFFPGRILKIGERIYAQIDEAKTDMLAPIIKEKIVPDSIVYSDGFKVHYVLDVSEFKHYRINHSKNFVKKHNYINGIKNFWNTAKRHLRKFNGIDKKYFNLFLKECEWIFNTRESLIALERF
jgi:transposase